MDQLTADPEFVRFVGGALTEAFVLIDVGAADGVASAWRAFGDKLEGFGFELDRSEVERLNRVEPAPRFRYVAAAAGLLSGHRFAQRRRGRPHVVRNPWQRLAVSRWFEIRRAADEGRPFPERSPRPWEADDSKQSAAEIGNVIDLPHFLSSNGITAIDFLKIDVDGMDFDILNSFSGLFEQLGILAVGIEVNFFGSADETDNTFHNIDRLLKGEEYELFDITVRRYSTQELPCESRSGLPYPADTRFGRPFQGDAFYARDLCAWRSQSFAQKLSAERLMKMAALFSLFSLPDCAAEVLVRFREQFAGTLDVDYGLDLLAKQAQPGVMEPLSYADYVAKFEHTAYLGRRPQVGL